MEAGRGIDNSRGKYPRSRHSVAGYELAGSELGPDRTPV
jgi:hypothetical protein